MSSPPIILQLGSNVGDRNTNLLRARSLIAKECNIKTSSSIFETEAWGVKDQPTFYNQLIEVTTTLNPYSLLRLCLNVETRMGRTREITWGPRIIDIDIIFYCNKIIFSPELRIPHPHFRERRFILEPLVELWGSAIDPVTSLNSLQLLDQCTDNSQVVRL